MVKVRTFTSELKIFQTARELQELDRAVNDFLASGKVARVISVSDTTTTDNTGATIGLVRVLTYEES
jgi:hypothetical protein